MKKFTFIILVLLAPLIAFRNGYCVEPEIVADIYEGTNGYSIADDNYPTPFGPPPGRPIEVCRIAASNRGNIYLFRKQAIFKVEQVSSLIQIYSPLKSNWITDLFIDTLGCLYTYEPTHNRGVLKNIRGVERYINTREVHKLKPDGAEIINYQPYFDTRHSEWELNWLPDGTLYFYGGENTFNIYSPLGEVVASDQESVDLYRINSMGRIYVFDPITRENLYTRTLKLYNINGGESVAEVVKNDTPGWTKTIDPCHAIFSITDDDIMVYGGEGTEETGLLINGKFVLLSQIKKGKILPDEVVKTSAPLMLPQIFRLQLPDGHPEYLNHGLDYRKFAGNGQMVHSRQVFVANNGDVYQVLQVWTHGAFKEDVDKMIVLRWRN